MIFLKANNKNKNKNLAVDYKRNLVAYLNVSKIIKNI